MSLDLLLGRRDFLVRTGLVLGAAGLGGVAAGCDTGDESEAPVSKPTVAGRPWEGVRAQFVLEPKLRHFKIVDALREKGIVATVTPYAAEYVRLGTNVLVSEDDVDFAVSEVAALA